VNVLVAPDKFRGTLTAEEAARAIATGWRRERPDDDLVLVPMADGGEGTLDTLVAALGGRRLTTRVSAPLGDEIDAEFGLLPGPTAVVEMARASGLSLLAASRRAPLRTSTRGTGDLIAAACEHHLAEAIVCIGGSATNDGGAGMARALGVRLLYAKGR
jgi:glycerate kinase